MFVPSFLGVSYGPLVWAVYLLERVLKYGPLFLG